MASMLISNFMMFLPETTKWFCLIGLAVFVFGIYIPYDKYKKKREKKNPPQKQQTRTAAEDSGGRKRLEQLKTLRDAGMLTEEEYRKKKRELQ